MYCRKLIKNFFKQLKLPVPIFFYEIPKIIMVRLCNFLGKESKDNKCMKKENEGPVYAGEMIPNIDIIYGFITPAWSI